MPEGERRKASSGALYYVTPQEQHWPRYNAFREEFGPHSEDTLHQPSMLDLSAEEAGQLALLELYVDFQIVRGGRAVVVNHRKKSVIRAEWRRHAVPMPGAGARVCAAHRWLMSHNATYAAYAAQHQEFLSSAEAATSSGYGRTISRTSIYPF